MKIEYPNKMVVRNGVFLSPMNSSAVPTIVFTGEKQKLYTLIMLDPDAVGGTRIHWLVVNLSSHDGTVIFPYNGPHPPQGTGKHHYYFALLEQANKIPIPRLKFTNRYENIHIVFRKLGLSSGIKILETLYFVSAAE